jgi:hypothetical protein
MSNTRPKFDPSRVADLLNRGNEEGRGVVEREAVPPVLASVPAAVEAPSASAEAAPAPARRSVRRAAPPEAAPEVEAPKRPITVRLTEEVLHALVRHQAEVRCKPGARLGDTTIGGVMDALLRGPLGLA